MPNHFKTGKDLCNAVVT